MDGHGNPTQQKGWKNAMGIYAFMKDDSAWTIYLHSIPIILWLLVLGYFFQNFNIDNIKKIKHIYENKKLNYYNF